MGLNKKIVNTADEAIIAHRRELVARARLRGASQREIVEALPKIEPPCINETTREPWSLGTINSDIKALQAGWGREAAKSVKTHKARQLAELQEARRQAWATNDIQNVLRGLAQEMTLLGTEAPKVTQLTGKDGGPLQILPVKGYVTISPDDWDNDSGAGQGATPAAQPDTADGDLPAAAVAD